MEHSTLLTSTLELQKQDERNVLLFREGCILTLAICVVIHVWMISTFSRVWNNRVWLSILLAVSSTGKMFFLCSHSRLLRFWSRETGSAVPSRVSLPILHTQAESGAC